MQPLTPALAQQLGLTVGTQGLVVVAIDQSGPAADAGIQRGDVIEQVNQQPVHTVEELRDAVQRSGAAPVLLLVNHRGTTVFITVKPSLALKLKRLFAPAPFCCRKEIHQCNTKTLRVLHLQSM